MPAMLSLWQPACIEGGSLYCKLPRSESLTVMSAAVGQIAKAMGAKVVAVCRGEAKAAALRQLGADAVIDTAKQPDTPLRALIKVPLPCPSVAA